MENIPKTDSEVDEPVPSVLELPPQVQISMKTLLNGGRITIASNPEEPDTPIETPQESTAVQEVFRYLVDDPSGDAPYTDFPTRRAAVSKYIGGNYSGFSDKVQRSDQNLFGIVEVIAEDINRTLKEDGKIAEEDIERVKQALAEISQETIKDEDDSSKKIGRGSDVYGNGRIEIATMDRAPAVRIIRSILNFLDDDPRHVTEKRRAETFNSVEPFTDILGSEAAVVSPVSRRQPPKTSINRTESNAAKPQDAYRAPVVRIEPAETRRYVRYADRRKRRETAELPVNSLTEGILEEAVKTQQVLLENLSKNDYEHMLREAKKLTDFISLGKKEVEGELTLVDSDEIQDYIAQLVSDSNWSELHSSILALFGSRLKPSDSFERRGSLTSFGKSQQAQDGQFIRKVRRLDRVRTLRNQQPSRLSQVAEAIKNHPTFAQFL